jgi:hypothetical protein
MKRFMRMATTFRATGNIVKVINPLNIERNVATTFDEGEIAPRIVDFR